MAVRRENPVFATIRQDSYVLDAGEQATYAGISAKTMILFFITVLSAFASVFVVRPETALTMVMISPIVALVAVLIGTRSVRLAAPFSMIYAVFKGMFLGVITLLFEIQFPGIATAAVAITFTIFGVMLFLYSTGTIRVGEKFRRIMISVSLGLLVFFLIVLVSSFFTTALSGAFFGENSPIAIPLSLFLLGFGAAMLLMDFDNATRIVSMGLDKRYEWTVALGLLVTIVWIYFQALRLLAIIMSRRN